MKKTFKKKKIKVVIAYQYLSFKGGIEEVIYNQSKLLKAKGYDVELLTSKYAENEPKFSRDNVLIHRIPSFNYAYKFLGVPFAIPVPTISNVKKIKKVIKSADVVNVHGHPYLASFIYILMSKLLSKPVLLTQHNTNIESNSKLINTVYYVFDRTIGRFNLANSNKVIAVSGETGKYVETLIDNKRKIEIIYNGVDTKRFVPTNSKNRLRKKFGIDTDKFVCITIRRLTFKNGIETFLNSAKLCNPRKTLFLLGGTGPDKGKIEEFIKKNKIKNVKMLGFVSDEDLASYYALSDVFILPSIQGEGFPMVVLEAFSSGIPVIATKSGGQVEIISDGATGFLVDINKPSQIYKKVEYLSENKKLLKAMSENCQKLVKKSLSWEKNISSLINQINLSI